MKCRGFRGFKSLYCLLWIPQEAELVQTLESPISNFHFQIESHVDHFQSAFLENLKETLELDILRTGQIQVFTLDILSNLSINE
mgnify:CR=1 FL=1